MKPQNTLLSGQRNLFTSRLENLIDHQHELVIASHKIDWAYFDERFDGNLRENNGRPALPTRLMVGLQYLKYL